MKGWITSHVHRCLSHVLTSCSLTCNCSLSNNICQRSATDTIDLRWLHGALAVPNDSWLRIKEHLGEKMKNMWISLKEMTTCPRMLTEDFQQLWSIQFTGWPMLQQACFLQFSANFLGQGFRQRLTIKNAMVAISFHVSCWFVAKLNLHSWRFVKIDFFCKKTLDLWQMHIIVNCANANGTRKTHMVWKEFENTNISEKTETHVFQTHARHIGTATEQSWNFAEFLVKSSRNGNQVGQNKINDVAIFLWNETIMPRSFFCLHRGWGLRSCLRTSQLVWLGIHLQFTVVPFFTIFLKPLLRKEG